MSLCHYKERKMTRIPPFCPNRECIHHHRTGLSRTKHSRWYQRDGTYATNLHKRIQRYVCTTCGTKFSSQTFSLDYGVKIPVSYRRIFEQICSGSGIRFLARNLKVSEKVVTNRIGRLARQSLALHARMRSSLSLTEDLAADGFESFTLSQYYPNNIHLLVGKRSQYLYGADYAHIRRKGRMTLRQRQKRDRVERLFRAPAGDLSRSFIRIIRQFLLYCERRVWYRVRLYTDEKPEYRRCITSSQELCSMIDRGEVRHTVISSRLPRTRWNDLFAVNYYDREVRKDQGNHARETVEFSRNVNNCMERLWVYAAYHNYVKPYRVGVKKERRCTHAEAAGILRSLIRREWKTFFTRRRFVSRCFLSLSERMTWYRCFRTPFKRWAEVCPQYACA